MKKNPLLPSSVPGCAVLLSALFICSYPGLLYPQSQQDTAGTDPAGSSPVQHVGSRRFIDLRPVRSLAREHDFDLSFLKLGTFVITSPTRTWHSPAPPKLSADNAVMILGVDSTSGPAVQALPRDSISAVGFSRTRLFSTRGMSDLTRPIMLSFAAASIAAGLTSGPDLWPIIGNLLYGGLFVPFVAGASAGIAALVPDYTYYRGQDYFRLPEKRSWDVGLAAIFASRPLSSVLTWLGTDDEATVETGIQLNLHRPFQNHSVQLLALLSTYSDTDYEHDDGIVTKKSAVVILYTALRNRLLQAGKVQVNASVGVLTAFLQDFGEPAVGGGAQAELLIPVTARWKIGLSQSLFFAPFGKPLAPLGVQIKYAPFPELRTPVKSRILSVEPFMLFVNRAAAEHHLGTRSKPVSNMLPGAAVNLNIASRSHLAVRYYGYRSEIRETEWEGQWRRVYSSLDLIFHHRWYQAKPISAGFMLGFSLVTQGSEYLTIDRADDHEPRFDLPFGIALQSELSSGINLRVSAETSGLIFVDFVFDQSRPIPVIFAMGLDFNPANLIRGILK
ncbi:MAG: hypothetical protein JSW54_10760 [Fidelibacterota bacterium]|nr:MAG: hypothetical protein JSW54_10760 [Candidatus Neomarinimicrobiota bacterium]